MGRLRMRAQNVRPAADLWTKSPTPRRPVDNVRREGEMPGVGRERILRYRGRNGRAQRFRKYRHGTDAQRAVLRPLGASPR